MNKLYKEFLGDSVLISQSTDYFLKQSNWVAAYGFDVLNISKTIWMSEPVINALDSQFKIALCSVLRIEPNVNYNWHTDTVRGVTVNMLLKDNHSHCLFGVNTDAYNDNFVELKYKPNKFYLFNTQHRHSVINFDSYRYVFSVEFEDDNTRLTYDDVYTWCNEKGMF